MLFLYLAVVITAMYWVVKMLAPEMAKPPLPKPTRPLNSFDFYPSNEADNRIEKLEILLDEKNKNIKVLQRELNIFHAQIRNFDKVKTLLEEEIHRVKEKNRMFRSELGISAVQPDLKNSTV